MTITLSLDPELEARLTGEAQSRGMALDVYVRTLIERREGLDRPDASGLAEFRATLNALAEGAARLPRLPAESFRRDVIYRDHD